MYFSKIAGPYLLLDECHTKVSCLHIELSHVQIFILRARSEYRKRVGNQTRAHIVFYEQ